MKRLAGGTDFGRSLNENDRTAGERSSNENDRTAGEKTLGFMDFIFSVKH